MTWHIHGSVRQIVCGLGVAFLALVLQARDAEALCVTQPEMGTWINADASTAAVRRITLEFVCQDQILNGQPHPPGPPWYATLFGACAPTDCDWGRVSAQRLGTGYIYAAYDQGFATRHVYAKMSTQRPGQLWVYIWTDFRDPARPDYALQTWFRRS